MTPRIAILGPAPPDRGGIAREATLLARELSVRAPVSHFTFSRRYPRWLDPRRYDADPSLAPSGAVPILDYASPGSWRQAAEAVAGLSAGALLVPWWTAFWGLPIRAVLRRLARLSPPTRRVLICHNVDDHEGGLGKRFLAAGAFLAADGFVAHCAADAVRLASIAPRRPVVVLPHPVPPFAGPSREEARRRLGLELSRPVVLFLGLVRRYKGVDTLLDAAPRIVRETGAVIAVVGEVFPDARELSRRAAASPVSESLLWKDAYVPEEEMDQWLSSSDLVVLPYRAISGSGIAARAISAGRPMAASAVGGLAEVVQSGVTGELFAPGDASGLAAAVRAILERGGAAYAPGLARAAENASWARYVDALLGFLSSPKAVR